MTLSSLLTALRGKGALQVENIALRHQLLVLQRTQKPKRLVLKASDRWLWAWLSRLWSAWRSALLMVKPETVIGWHRQGFRWYWTWDSPESRPVQSVGRIVGISEVGGMHHRYEGVA